MFRTLLLLLLLLLIVFFYKVWHGCVYVFNVQYCCKVSVHFTLFAFSKSYLVSHSLALLNIISLQTLANFYSNHMLFTVYCNCCLQCTAIVVYSVLQLLFTVYCSCCLQCTAVVVYSVLQLLFTVYCNCCLQCTTVVVYNVLFTVNSGSFQVPVRILSS